MRVLINAIALKVAGSRSVCMNFLKSLEMVGRGHEYFVFLPAGVGYEILENKEYLKIKFIPLGIVGPGFRYYIDHIYLKRQVRKIHPDVIFSMGNIALPVKTIPQLLLFHLAQVVYPESVYRKRLGWRGKLHYRLVKREIVRKFRYATCIAVQTDSIRNRMLSLFDIEEKLRVIPNAVSVDAYAHNNTKSGLVTNKNDTNKNEFRFLCLSRYYEHKNLEIFIPLATLIKKNRLNYKIIITITAEQGRKALDLLDKIEEFKLADVIQNIGYVEMTDIPAAYQSVDALILPTLLESFSGTYIESAYYQKPIFTSDIDFAHDVCSASAIYFDPLNAQDILDKMKYIEDFDLMNHIIQCAVHNLNRFPDWSTVAGMYLQEMEKMSQVTHEAKIKKQNTYR